MDKIKNIQNKIKKTKQSKKVMEKNYDHKIKETEGKLNSLKEKIKELGKNYKELIDEAVKRGLTVDELIELLEKSPEVFESITEVEKPPGRFKEHYISSDLIKLSQNLFETQKLNKKGRDIINVDFTEGEMEVEVWEGKKTKYYIKIADLPELKGSPPKLYVSQLKNFYLLMGLIQEQQYNNSVKEAECKFTLSYYAKRRGYTKEKIKDGGKFFSELKRDLTSGAYTNYKIDKLKIEGKFYDWLGNLYGLGKPRNPKEDWIVNFNYPYSKMILSVLEGEARPYFVKNPKAIEDRTTDNKPYLFLFYIQLTKRKQRILTTKPIKIKSLLKDMQLPDKILKRPKECFKILKECIIYFSENYQPLPELESFIIYNYLKNKTVKLPLNISETFKKYSYEDFKEILKSMGIKDIREARISFKRPHSKPRIKSKLNKEGTELRDDILEWTRQWEELRNYPINKTEEERSKFIDDRIKFLGYEEVNDLFEEEKNKEKPHAFNFLIYVLSGRENYEDTDWDNY